MNDLVQRPNNSLPAYLQGQTKTERFGNFDRSDLVIPRIKLLASVSPEVEDFEAAKAGEFWHSILNESMGKEPTESRWRSSQDLLLAPEGDERGIQRWLRDGTGRDPPEGGTLRVKLPKNLANPHLEACRPTQAESRGFDCRNATGRRPKSRPAAAPTARNTSVAFQSEWT